MRFSVIVPVYNVENYIGECIDSILKQTYSDYEIILIDDGSTDKSGIICDQYAKKNAKVSVIHKKNGGLISARRIGFHNATGDYCVSCDSDDFLECDALERISSVIESCQPDIVIYGAYYYEQGVKKPFLDVPLPAGLVKDKNVLYKVFMTTYSINSLCMKAFNRKLLDLEKDYSSFYGCSYGEDKLQTAPLFVNADSIYYLPEKLYNYRYNSGMMRRFSENYYESYKRVNREVICVVQKENIRQLNEYDSFNVLIAAYGATTQYKYKKKFCSTELAAIANDDDFINAYSAMQNSKLKLEFSIKQKLILWLLHLKRYGIIKLLLEIR